MEMQNGMLSNMRQRTLTANQTNCNVPKNAATVYHLQPELKPWPKRVGEIHAIVSDIVVRTLQNRRREALTTQEGHGAWTADGDQRPNMHAATL